VAALWITRFPTKTGKPLIALSGFLTLVPPWVALVALTRSEPHGANWLLFVLALIWSADIGAYFVGRGFGRIKLAPTVSPGKTWEGVLGGLGFAALTGAAGAYWSSLPYEAFVPLCIAVAAISVVGDLTVSMFKRATGLKDSGRLFPGHGGILDRIDSINAAAPIFVLGAGWLGVIV
jgi:phosphatidate cytidylyltransferase